MGKFEKKLSVVIVSYNHEKYIAQAIESVLMQEVDFSYELLIGDDCSADGTPSIIAEYAREYDIIRPIYQSENVGANRNAYETMIRAKGKYIAFLEGDDYWTDPQKLQTQVDFLETHKDYIGCTHRISIVDENGNTRKNQTLPWINFKKRFTLKDFDGVTLPGQASTLVRKNLFVKSGIDMSIIYHTHPMIGDRTSVLVYLCKGDFGGVDREMGCYRQYTSPDATNITSEIYLKNEDKIKDEIDLTENLELIAWSYFHRKVDFCSYKRSLFVSALYQYFKKPTPLTKSALRYAYQHNENKILCILSVPLKICQKIWNNIKQRRVD